MLSSKDDIAYELCRLNDRLREFNYHLDVTMVGSAALIMNDIYAIETEDIDTISRIEDEIKVLLDDLSIDLNDDALDYIENYRNREFIPDESMSLSNISIDYLDIPGAILTKMQNLDDDCKIAALETMLSEVFDVEMTPTGVESFLDQYGYTCGDHDRDIIEAYLDAI